MPKTKKTLAVLSFVALAAACVGFPAAADDDDGKGEAAAGARTLNGHFVWTSRDNKGDLEAVFTPTGEATWDVDFHFSFRGKPHKYSGTAEGSIGEGELKGTVQNENRQRSFTFSGAFDGGTFSGTHAETTGDEEVSTGTLTLSE